MTSRPKNTPELAAELPLIPTTGSATMEGGQMKRYGFIDTDSHVIEPDDLWERYLDPKFRSETPHTRVGYETRQDGFGFYNDVEVGGCKMPFGSFGHTSVM